MIPIASLLIVLLLSLIIVRVAAVALTLTGVSRAVAGFQARSAWTGTGFTTTESEALISHPVRRQIISLLMLLRGAGLVTAASALMLSFVNVEDRGEGVQRLLMLIAGLALIWLFARSHWIDRWLSRIIAAALKRYTDLDTRDYAAVLHLAGEYAIMEIEVRPSGWLAGKQLGELRLADEGILALGISRPDGTYIGAPRGETEIGAQDTLILYGRSPALAEIGRRRANSGGDRAHSTAVAEVSRTRRTETDQEIGGSATGGDQTPQRAPSGR